MAFITYRIGRSSKADFIINHETVSRVHLEVTITGNQKMFCIDCNTTHGTFIHKHGKWEPFVQGYVSQTDTLKLCQTRVTLQDFFSWHQTHRRGVSGPLTNEFEPLSVKPKRDTATGEVVGRNQ